METAQLENVLDHTRPVGFMDAAPSGGFYDSLATMDYLQYPHSPFSVDMGRKYILIADYLENVSSSVFPFQSPRRPLHALVASTLS